MAGALTVNEIVVVTVRPADIPVTVTVEIPTLAVLLAVRVRTLDVVVGFELNEAVTPLGNPDTDKLTLPLKPFCGVTLIVLVPLLP